MLGFPLLLVPFTIFNMIVFLVQMDWGTKLYTFQLKSGVTWEPTAGDAFVVFSLLMLMFEFIKSNRHGKSFVEHFLSLLLAGGATAEFVMVNPATVMQGATFTPASNSIFVLLITIIFVDLFAGFSASLRRARRAVVVEPVEPAPPLPVATRVAPTPRAEPVATIEPVVKTEPAAKIEPRPDPFVKVEPAEKIQ